MERVSMDIFSRHVCASQALGSQVVLFEACTTLAGPASFCRMAAEASGHSQSGRKESEGLLIRASRAKESKGDGASEIWQRAQN